MAVAELPRKLTAWRGRVAQWATAKSATPLRTFEGSNTVLRRTACSDDTEWALRHIFRPSSEEYRRESGRSPKPHATSWLSCDRTLFSIEETTYVYPRLYRRSQISEPKNC